MPSRRVRKIIDPSWALPSQMLKPGWIGQSPGKIPGMELAQIGVTELTWSISRGLVSDMTWRTCIRKYWALPCICQKDFLTQPRCKVLPAGTLGSCSYCTQWPVPKPSGVSPESADLPPQDKPCPFRMCNSLELQGLGNGMLGLLTWWQLIFSISAPWWGVPDSPVRAKRKGESAQPVVYWLQHKTLSPGCLGRFPPRRQPPLQDLWWSPVLLGPQARSHPEVSIHSD